MSHPHFFRRATGLVLAGFAVGCVAAGTRRLCAKPGVIVRQTVHDGSLRREALKKEIAELEAKGRGVWPEFEAELRRWEAQVMQPGADGTTKTAAARAFPANLQAILAMEPSEREPEQREELAAHFRPRSKTFADLVRRLKMKRAELAVLKSGAVPGRR